MNKSASVSTWKSPPQASVKELAMERPKPLPPSVRLASPRTNRAVRSTPVGSSSREGLRRLAYLSLKTEVGRLASALPTSVFKER